MATSSNIVVRDYEPLTVAKVEVASATEVAPGDLIDYSSAGTVSAVYADEANVFLGVALEGSENGDTDFISVATRAKISARAVAAGYLGDMYHYTSGASGTNWIFSNGTTEGMMWALEDQTVDTDGLFLIDSHALAGGLLFEKP